MAKVLMVFTNVLGSHVPTLLNTITLNWFMVGDRISLWQIYLFALNK